jgi:hypothetical protein
LPPVFSAYLPGELYDNAGNARQYLELEGGGQEKTRLLTELALHGAQFEPLVRDTAIALVRGLPNQDHRGRLRRLHEFVRDSVPYHREPVEMLHPATYTILHGGDCDDHTIALGALAWSLRYPFRIEAVGDPANPYHYTIALGYPPGELPGGDGDTRWLYAETTVPGALLGEWVHNAVARTGNAGGT